MTAPLRLLMDIHVEEALSLGLLSLSSLDALALDDKLDAIWTSQPDDLKAFYEGIDLLDNFSASMTWLEYHGDSNPTVHRIARIADLKYPLEETLLIRPTNRLNLHGISATMLAWKKTMPESSVQPSNTKDGGRSSEHTNEAGRGRRLLRRLG